jgi:hypothetical protein
MGAVDKDWAIVTLSLVSERVVGGLDRRPAKDAVC